MDNLTKLKIARTAFNEDIRSLARRFGVSDRYIYKVLKYPNINTGLYQKIAQYVNEADISVKGQPVELDSTENLTPVN